MTPRSVRHWRNAVKSSYSHLLERKAKTTEALRLRQLEIKREEEMRVIEAEKRQQEKVEREQQQ